MTNADWANKDFYKVLGVAKDAVGGRASRRPTASWPVPTTPTPTPATRPPRSASRRSPRPTTWWATPRSASSTTSCARSASAASGRSPAAAPAAPPFDFSDLFGGGTRTTAAAAVSATSSAACSAAGGARTRTTAQPRRGADIETDATHRVRRRHRGRHRLAAADLATRPARTARAPAPRPGTLPRVCPDCEGVGMRAASVGGAFTMNETCPTCRGRGLVVDDPCPTCHGSGRGMSNRTISARIPAGVKDGQRIRLRGKGAAGERGGPARRPLRHRARQPAPALRPQGRQPHPHGPGHASTRPRSARRSRCRR